jgi:hypothetical protein
MNAVRSARAGERLKGASSERPEVSLTAGGFAAGESTREGVAGSRSEAEGASDEAGEA